jgi:hypothetical protein
MTMSQEFHYRLPHRAAGWRPGSHRGSTLGAGLEFASHASLYDRPDPRRLDLRASLRHPGGDWLVRVQQQRVGITVHALVDVSASMRFGSLRTKLDIATDFVQALGSSAYRAGDAFGMLAFDARARDDLYVPPRHSRGMGSAMAASLARSDGGAGGVEGLEDAARQLGNRRELVFIVSDFHWELARLPGVLDALAPALVVPLVVWDESEIEPPTGKPMTWLEDMESGQRRTLWMRPRLRSAWRDAVALRRAALADLCATRGVRPFFVRGEFRGDAMSAYFLEAA